MECSHGLQASTDTLRSSSIIHFHCVISLSLFHFVALLNTWPLVAYLVQFPCVSLGSVLSIACSVFSFIANATADASNCKTVEDKRDLSELIKYHTVRVLSFEYELLTFINDYKTVSVHTFTRVFRFLWRTFNRIHCFECLIGCHLNEDRVLNCFSDRR